jgi:hypothetical protein
MAGRDNLVDFLSEQTPGKAEDNTILQGKLVRQTKGDYLKVDNQAALWGPVTGAELVPSGSEVVAAIDQNNKIYIVWVKGSSNYEFYEQTTEPTQAAIGAWWVDTDSENP